MSDRDSSVPPWEQGGSRPEDNAKGFAELVDLAKLKTPVTKMRIAGLRAGLPPSRMDGLISDAQAEADRIHIEQEQEANEDAVQQQPQAPAVNPAPAAPAPTPAFQPPPPAPAQPPPVKKTPIHKPAPVAHKGGDENEAYEELLKHALNGMGTSLLEKVVADYDLPPDKRSELIARAQTEAGSILNLTAAQIPDAGQVGVPDSDAQFGNPQDHEEGGAEAQIFIGIALIAIGIIATWIDYSITKSGGSYRIWWGASIYGLYLLIKNPGYPSN
ncbi:MAG: hypothetical protein ACYTDT_08350 [Planctomycetota bacterium]|jgi:hypothetical protein